MTFPFDMPTKKLTPQQISDIKKLCKTHSQRQVAMMFGVSAVNVHHIVRGRKSRSKKLFAVCPITGMEL